MTTPPVSDEPLDLTLLPASARIEADGSLSVGGVDLVGLASEYGTPLYVYDEGELRARCREYRARFGAGVAYASKAFLCTAMAQLVAEEGLDLDVATGGELHVALNAGFPAARIVFHGNNKSTDELRAAIAAGVGRIVADSFDELDRLEVLVGSGAEPVGVLVRVTPGVEAHTHEFIETGTEDSKFGFGLANGDALEAATRVAQSRVLRLAGLHCHIGSQVFRVDSYAAAVDRMVGLVLAVETETGATIDELNFGGGLGVRYVATDEGSSIAQHAALLQQVFTKALAEHGVRSHPLLTVEPGRSIAAPSGLTVYTVGTIKTIPGVRTYVAVDGGMSDNVRPVTYGAQYEAFLPARVGAARPRVVTVAGKHCEQGDVLVRDAHLPADVAVGDILATPVTGAYAHSMASNYNKVLRPAVVFVHEGRARLVVRRETPADLVRLDSV
jgi:diaminopimelate decarboxylase